MLALDGGGEARQRDCRNGAVDGLGAGEIEERLVDRDRLHERRQIEHHRPHGAADGGIFAHVGPHDRRVRAKLQRLEHRHGGAHAVDARVIAGGQNHAALAAADDHRPVA